MRNLASIKRIQEVAPIEGADAIEAARVDGWWVVSKKDEYKVGDLVVYLEIDSWVPHNLAPFLSKGKEPREFEGVLGERLRTVKLRGQVSQGLLLPLSVIDGKQVTIQDDEDVTEILGILKYEKPIPACLAGTARGNFPSFIPKTDETRIQSVKVKDLESWMDHYFVETLKIDGSSTTMFIDSNDGSLNVCSRNMNLIEVEGNTFWNMARKYSVEERLKSIIEKQGRNLAIQGETFGASIQGNPEKIKDQQFRIFSMFDIDAQAYLGYHQIMDYIDMMNSVGDGEPLEFVKVFGLGLLKTFGTTRDDFINRADGESMSPGTIREGFVYKSLQPIDGEVVSFKAISNRFLIKGGE